MSGLGSAIGRVFSRWVPGLQRPEPRVQSGVLPYRIVDGRVEYLLITSRRSKRWLFPKGGLMKGMTPWESAAQEALEEAGVEGTVETTPIGSYDGALNDRWATPVTVEVYPLHVEVQHKYWQEQAQRRRAWMTADKARERIDDPQKRAIIDAFEARLVN